MRKKCYVSFLDEWAKREMSVIEMFGLDKKQPFVDQVQNHSWIQQFLSPVERELQQQTNSSIKLLDLRQISMERHAVAHCSSRTVSDQRTVTKKYDEKNLPCDYLQKNSLEQIIRCLQLRDSKFESNRNSITFISIRLLQCWKFVSINLFNKGSDVDWTDGEKKKYELGRNEHQRFFFRLKISVILHYRKEHCSVDSDIDKCSWSFSPWFSSILSDDHQFFAIEQKLFKYSICIGFSELIKHKSQSIIPTKCVSCSSESMIKQFEKILPLY